MMMMWGLHQIISWLPQPCRGTKQLPVEITTSLYRRPLCNPIFKPSRSPPTTGDGFEISPSPLAERNSRSQSSSRFRRVALSQKCSWRVGSSATPQWRSRSSRLRIAQQTATRPASRRHPPTNTQTTRPVASCMGFCRINPNTAALARRRSRSSSPRRRRTWCAARNAGRC